MKWFKHDSNSFIDAKLKRLRIKYGMEGYGLYWYLLECVARTIEPHNLTFELEEDAEVIASEIDVGRELVEDMMRFMVELGIFENSEGRITCLKMLTRSDEYTTKLIRKSDKLLTKSRQAPDKIPPIRIEENRIEQNRKEQKVTGASRFTPPTLEELKTYVNEKNYRGFDCDRFMDHYISNGWMVGKNKMKAWKSAANNWNRNSGFSSNGQGKAPSASDSYGV